MDRFGSNTDYLKLDEEFDKFLVDMKPYVLTLPHKSDRQRCALWIKKLCEPPSSGITGRKNRNMYSQLMLHMLKRGTLEGPFTRKPEEGALPTLPTYMSIYFDEPSTKCGGPGLSNGIPDWVTGELALGDLTTSSLGFGLPITTPSLGDPSMGLTGLTASSQGSWRSSPSRTADYALSPPSRRPHSSVGTGLDRRPWASPPRGILSTKSDRRPFSLDDMSLGVKPDERPVVTFQPDDLGLDLPKNSLKSDEKAGVPSITDDLTDTDWSRPLQSTFNTDTSSLRSIGLSDDRNIYTSRSTEKEVELKTKMLEAKFQEEKLSLQQKHDSAVQKILDRKNAEIEDVKSHYRQKAKDMEESIGKLEKKSNTQQKDNQTALGSKDKQIAELKTLLQETGETRKSEYDKRLHETLAEFEQEKFEMQKQHTKNIQEILDDTNTRLQRMEQEYGQQTMATTAVIKELETRVHQLTNEAQNTAQLKNILQREKVDQETNLERREQELGELRAKYSQLEQDHQHTLEEQDQELRGLHSKTDATVEFLKQEQNISAAKAADTIAELEQHVEQLKRGLKDSEEQRQRQIREAEQVYQQDKLHLENLHDKQIRSLKRELEQLENDSQKKLKHLEHVVRDKDEEMKHVGEQNKVHALQAERALDDFKSQVEKNQTRVYDEMKLQMERVEADLNRSKQLREKQSHEYASQIEDVRQRHDRELMELKIGFEQEKSQLLQECHAQKELVQTDLERELENVKSTHHFQMKEIDQKLREKQDRDTKMITELEKQSRELREELVQSNQLRKQQLVELGLLREEEKQKMQRDQEAQMVKMRSEMEQQRLELQKTHGAEMEKMLEKANGRLKDIEREYTERAQKSTENIAELQASMQQLREDMKKQRQSGDRKMTELNTRHEEDKKSLRKQQNSSINGLQRELDSQYSKVRTLEKKLEGKEVDHEEKLTELKMHYEERMHGLMPSSVRQELEDTISSLKSQVQTIQQRVLLLQDELSMSPLSSYTRSSIKSPI